MNPLGEASKTHHEFPGGYLGQGRKISLIFNLKIFLMLDFLVITNEYNKRGRLGPAFCLRRECCPRPSEEEVIEQIRGPGS